MKGMGFMKGIFEWILNNKEWLFSGLGITIAGLIYRKRERYLAAVKFYIKRIVTGLKIHKEKEKIDNSIFVSEEPLDGITIPCNHVFEKKWIVRNSGNTVWKNRYLKCIEYPGKSFCPEKDMIKIKTVYPGETVALKVRYYANVEGDYRSRWKMCDKDGNIIYPEKSIGVGVNIHVRNSR